MGASGTGTKALPPDAVVGHAVLFPSQCWCCPCGKEACWDQHSLAVSNILDYFSQWNWSCT